MAEVRCVFRAHYKAHGMSFYDIGRFEQWLPETQAARLMNDRQGRIRLFMMHFPTCEKIDRDDVVIELHERR